jgi:hypothetical protein
MTRRAGAPRLPEHFTLADNVRLDSPEFAALAHRNPRAVVLLLLYDRRRYWGAPGNLLPNGGLALNGRLALSRRTVAPFMCKGAQGKALADLQAAGFIHITTPARPPDAAARVLIVDDARRWRALHSPKRAQRRRQLNGQFIPTEKETKSPERTGAPEAPEGQTGKTSYGGSCR